MILTLEHIKKANDQIKAHNESIVAENAARIAKMKELADAKRDEFETQRRKMEIAYLEEEKKRDANKKDK